MLTYRRFSHKGSVFFRGKGESIGAAAVILAYLGLNVVLVVLGAIAAVYFLPYLKTAD